MKDKLTYYLVYALWYLASLLPLRVLYVLSDLLYYPLYYCMRYRRKVVRKNLVESFPEKSEAEIVKIERDFYHHFCDDFVETLKLFTMSYEEIMRRMTFGGLDELKEVMKEKSVVLYMGHYCNWEWVASFTLHMKDRPDVACGQIYRKLDNAAFDRLFLHARGRFGGVSLEMHSALRSLVRFRKQGQRYIVAFISDQGPTWPHTKMWTDFLNHKTSFFIGAENLAKLTDSAVYFLDMRRVKRGYYHADFVKMAENPKEHPDYELTEEYGRRLEQMIMREPQYWLWSHKRWKRTYEKWLEMQKEKQ